MAKRGSRAATSPATNPHGSPSVHGLEFGRQEAKRHQRRKRRRDRFVAFVTAVFVLAAVGGVAWFGYGYYEDQQEQDRVESDQRRSELQNDGSGDKLRDAIDQLETEPKWNGPGNPNFGVGEDPADQP